MAEVQSSGTKSTGDTLPLAGMHLGSDDLWWFDPAQRGWTSPDEVPAWPSPTIPSQGPPALAFRQLAATPADRRLVTRFASHCDPEALRARFFFSSTIDPEEMQQHCCGYLLAGLPGGAALMAFCGPEPVGVLNLVPIGELVAEAGVLVATAWQRRGIARALVAELGRDTRWTGWTVRAVMQSENTAVRNLVRSLPGTRRTTAQALGCIEMDLQPFVHPQEAPAAPEATPSGWSRLAARPRC